MPTDCGPSRHSRRRCLAAAGAGALALLPGCSGLDVGLGLGGGTTRYDCGAANAPTVRRLPPPTHGSDGVPTVTAFLDLASDACRSFVADVLAPLVDRRVVDGRAQLLVRDLPVPADERWSWVLANAARSVQDARGGGAYVAFVRELVADGEYDMNRVGAAAAARGLDPCPVITDARARAYQPVVEADRRAARQRGITSPPVVRVRGERVRPTREAVLAAVDDG